MTRRGGTLRRTRGGCARPRPRRAPAAFTLLELILVILLIALFATVTAPRLTGTHSRRADLEVDAVRSLLSTVAHREATGTEPLALVYNAQTATLSVEVRRLLPASSGRGEELAWRQDRLITPVALSLVELRDASTDLDVFGRRSWRIVLPATEPRPNIRVVLGGRGADAERSWTVELRSGAPAASLVQPGAPSPPGALPAAIDLDAAGRGNQAW